MYLVWRDSKLFTVIAGNNAGLLGMWQNVMRGRFVRCEVELGLRGGGGDPKGRGKGGGIAGRRFYWGLIAFMFVVCLLFCCVCSF